MSWYLAPLFRLINYTSLQSTTFELEPFTDEKIAKPLKFAENVLSLGNVFTLSVKQFSRKCKECLVGFIRTKFSNL